MLHVHDCIYSVKKIKTENRRRRLLVDLRHNKKECRSTTTSRSTTRMLDRIASYRLAGEA